MLLPQRCFALLFCTCTFIINVKFGAAASILQALTRTSSDLKDGYFNVTCSYLSEFNCNHSENAGKEHLLQNKLQSVELSNVSQKEVYQPKNVTYLIQMFHISRNKRGKRNAVDLMKPRNRRHRKLKKVPGMNRLDAGKSDLRIRRKKTKKRRKTFFIPLPFPNGDRDQELDNSTTAVDTNSSNARPLGRKSKRKRRKLIMPLPFPNAESSEVPEINNFTVNDSRLPDEVLKSSSLNLENDHTSSIGINVNEGGQFVVTADKDTVDENIKLPVKRVKRHKVKKVKIPLPFNSVPKVPFEEAKRENEKGIVVIRTKRHRKRKRKRFTPLN